MEFNNRNLSRSKKLHGLAIITLLLSPALAFPLIKMQARSQERGVGVRSTTGQQGVLTGHALLIYVQDYQDANLKLDNPKNDAEKLESVLSGHYQFEKGNIRLLPNPDRESLLNSLQEYAERLTDKDSLLIFYADMECGMRRLGKDTGCHGMRPEPGGLTGSRTAISATRSDQSEVGIRC